MADFRGRGFAQSICYTDERTSENKDLQVNSYIFVIPTMQPEVYIWKRQIGGVFLMSVL